jgi:hypothetical protein
MDALNIISDLRGFGLEPTIVDVGLGRADFRLAVKIEDPLDIYYTGKCLNKYLLAIAVEEGYLYFENLLINEQVFIEIAGG